jgi:arylsulfatase A-like enzyme
MSRLFSSLGISIWACVFLLLGGPAAAAEAEEPGRPPNILLLIADDLGWRDVGYHDSDIRTPNLDRLARGGVRLERHYVYPTCSPTRAGLLTGRNPSRFGIHGPIADRSKESLPRDTVTLASVLQKRGYTTALFGKWHLGLTPDVGPRKYGFARSYGYLHGQIDQLTHRYKNGDRTWHRDDVFVDETGHATDLITAETLAFLRSRGKEPFFLWVAFSVPHHPLQEEERWLKPYSESIKDPSRRLYAACVSHMDDAIGQIVETLEKTGQAKDTLILFTSDNGGQKDYASKTEYEGKHGPNPTLGDNRPWRGWKGSLYEGGIRVPAFVSWPGRLKPAEVKEPVSYLDWFPTLSALAGAAPAAEWKIEGRNVWPLLTGEGRPAPPVLYWHTGRDEAVMADDWKLIVTRKKDEAELYHLSDDPAEKINQAEKNPRKVEELRRILAEQRKGNP